MMWSTAECIGLAVAFVGSLYLAPARIRALGHDDPRQIKQRGAALSVVCAVSLGYTVLTCAEGVPFELVLGLVGIRVDGIVMAAVLPLALTVVLFLGPIVCRLCESIAYQRLRHNIRHAARGAGRAHSKEDNRVATADAAPPFVFKWPTVAGILRACGMGSAIRVRVAQSSSPPSRKSLYFVGVCRP